MKRYKTSWWRLPLAALVCLSACTTNDIDPNTPNGSPPSKGTANFTKYVAVGNSLTAGFADATASGGGLYREGQLNSYPNILAGQFRLAGGGNFVQPLFSEEQAAGSGYTKLVRLPSATDPTSLLTAFATVAPGAVRATTSGAGTPLLTKFTEANQNLGVPGLRVSNLLTAGYGSTQGNPYFERLVANPASTYFQYVSDNLSGATFYTCWLGNNDALQYATTGGVVELTPAALFSTNFTVMMNKLAEGGRQGVVIGIPDILTAPYFQTYPLSLVLATLNQVVRPATPITALVIQTSNGVRATQSGDLLMLTNALEYAKIGRIDAGTRQGPYGLSTTNPLPTQYTLDVSEQAAMNARITEYNNIMKAQADAKGAAYLDPNRVLSQLTSATGLVQDGITFSASYIQGGVYSLDGLHLTPAGYALMANEIIKATNAKYGSTVPTVNVANYRRVLLQP